MRSDITKTSNRIKSGDASVPQEELQPLLSRPKDLLSKVQMHDATILNIMVSQDEPQDDIDAEYCASVEYTDTLLFSISILEQRISALSSAPNISTHNNHAAPNKIKLPQLPLPTYAHKEGESLNTFFATFESIVDKYGVTDYEKFVFLQGQLSGEPLNLIKSLDIGSQSYQTAKNLLSRAFASTINQQFENIKRLAELKFSIKNPYEYIGKLRQIKEAFQSLNITTDIVLQYFFWRSMPEALQNQFIRICNCNKPNIDDLGTQIFDAMERYLESVKKPISKSSELEVTSNAISMNSYRSDSQRQFCSLCSSPAEKITSHSTYNCQKYPSTVDKINRLNEVNGCVACGNVTHDVTNCRYRFKRACLGCSKFHFTYLCPLQVEPKPKAKTEQPPKPAARIKLDKKSKPPKNESLHNTNVACTWINEANFDNTGHDSILPTFSLNLNNRNVRVMRDSACQSSFIKQSLADELNLKVLKEFELGINGFNSSKQIQTTVVELPICKNKPPISLICIPEIRTKLKLPGLQKIAQDFSNRGYMLADHLLTTGGDEISNIEIIIGENEAHIIPQTDVLFGENSMYSQCSFGVMLVGSIQRMKTNLKFLPRVNNADHPFSCAQDTVTDESYFLHANAVDIHKN